MLKKIQLLALTLGCAMGTAHADESLFGTLRGAETLPQGAIELVQQVNHRYDKGQGSYSAIDTKTELEYGLTHRLTGAMYVLGQSINTSGIDPIPGYLPGPMNRSLTPSGIEASLKYNFLSPAKDDFGLAAYFSTAYSWLDPHSGQNKDKLTFETELLAQKYFLDGQLIWVGNLGLEATAAQRGAINLPAGWTSDDWSTDPEMEIGFKAGTGLSYRFAPNWFVSGEVIFQSEHETGVGRERWSVFAGPSLHYGGKKWWATLSYLPQIHGGGEVYDGQSSLDLHLIEKTKQEVRFKVGYNF